MRFTYILMQRFFYFSAVLISLFITQVSTAQKDLQQKLEQKRLNLQKEILQINKQLLQTKKTERSALNEYSQIKRKINIRQKLIQNLQEEINHINRAIKKNEAQTVALNKELKQLKQDYAKMIRQSYNSRSRQDKLYFLFSSKSFQQAFKRAQYLKQYAKYRKRQAQHIEEKKVELAKLKQKLQKDKAVKQKLYQNYQQETKTIKIEQQKQFTVVKKIKKKKRYYLKKIKAKQREQAKIDKMIENLIKKAIARSNKGQKKSQRHSGKFFLTPEAKKLASKFSTNKGALPWPLKKANIIRKFGRQPHEIFKNLVVINTGIYLETEPGSKVYSVFDGTVLQIQFIPGGNNSVFIKHGDYITIYGNLNEVYVKPGEKVKIRQTIGKVATDAYGKTEMKFRIFKNTTNLDPEKWLLRH